MCLKPNQQLVKLTFLGIVLISSNYALTTYASNLDNIGATLLQTVTTNLNGAGIRVAQPEGYDGSGNPPPWEVNPAAGVAAVNQPTSLFTYRSSLGSSTAYPNSVGSESSHADIVAALFYGAPNGVATNVAHVDNYDANYFMQISYQVVSGTTNWSVTLPSSNINDRVVNQSFVLSTTDVSLQKAIDLAYDNYAAQYNTLFVSGVDNGGTVPPPATCYNGIAVGVYGNPSSLGPTLDNGRSKPDITVPEDATSFSTPLVAGSAALLIQAGLRGDGGAAVTNAASDIRTVKALLLNGAIKPSNWSHSASAPLDPLYGAGIANVFNSYMQLTYGRHPFIASSSVALGAAHPPTGAAGTIPTLSGWDYSTNTSTTTADVVNHYYLNASNSVPDSTFTATATLVWNRLTGMAGADNLDLFLYDAVSSNLIASSTSTVDNVEHLFVMNLPQGRYDLQVLKHGGASYHNGGPVYSQSETYALAFEFFTMPLAISATDTNTILSWPVYPAGFRLLTSSSLTPSMTWIPATNTVQVSGSSQNQVLLDSSGVGQLFLLQRP
jgi:hypothetical protein